SQGQQRLWFLEELNPASGAAYHVCGGLDLHGPVEGARMGEALDRVVSRHESLRTRLALVDGELSQVIAPELRVAMGCEDVREHPERLAEITTEVATERFDLAHGPLVRARLLRLGDESYRLLLAAHHAVCDGWSVQVFIKDLLQEYR